MAAFKGKVKKVIKKEFEDGGVSISFTLAGQEPFFRLGSKRLAGVVEEGNSIEFYGEQVSDKAVKVKTDTVKAASGKPAGEGGSSASSARSDTSHDIHYQSARKDALAFVQVVIAAGAIKLPAKESGKLEALEAALDRYTAAFYADIETKGAVARVKGPAKGDEAAADEEPADDDGDDE